MSDAKNRQSLALPILMPVGVLAVIGLVLFGFSRVLLAVSHSAATVVAVIAAAGALGVAAFVASRSRVNSASLYSMVAAMTGIAMVAGGLAVVAAPLEEEPEGAGEGVAVTLAAPEGAAADGFSTDALSVPSEAPFTIDFDNQDPAVPHNVVIYEGEDDSAPALFTGELVTGPMEAIYEVEPLAEGAYFFNCEVHPTTMSGTITASPDGGGGGGGDLVVAARNLAFDTDRIELPADTPAPLTFDNQETGVPHNIAIYDDDSLGETLFGGETITGPAEVVYDLPALPEGEYYFQCDVHPDMNGTVIAGATAPEGGGAGGPDEGEGGGGGPPPESEGTGTAAVAAENTAFVPNSLSWAANTEITLTFDDRDDAAVAGQHNVSIYDGETAAFQGELVSGPATVDYAIPPLEPGPYEFRCDVHPTMVGTLEVT